MRSSCGGFESCAAVGFVSLAVNGAPGAVWLMSLWSRRFRQIDAGGVCGVSELFFCARGNDKWMFAEHVYCRIVVCGARGSFGAFFVGKVVLWIDLR